MTARHLVVAEAGTRAAAIVAQLAAGEGEVALLVIHPGVAAIERDMMLAALPELARALAPERRIGAVVAMPGADEQAVEAALAYLESARSTTGQVLTVAPD